MPKWQFDGTVLISQDPVALWEDYAATLVHQNFGPERWFRKLTASERAEDGYYRSNFEIGGPPKFLEELFIAGLGRHVEIRSRDGSRILWEGKIWTMELRVGDGLTKISLADVKNVCWIRYRVTGTSSTLRSTVYTDAGSLARYGRIEYPVNAGELENAAVANAAAQVFLKRLAVPKQGKASTPNGFYYEKPILSVECHGYSDTWNWQCYNQTATSGNQSASAQISDIATAKFAYVARRLLDTNATVVSKVYDMDMTAGSICRNISKIGDGDLNRWLLRMESGRVLRFKQAAPGVLPPAVV